MQFINVKNMGDGEITMIEMIGLKKYCYLILCLFLIVLTGCNNTEQTIQNVEEKKSDYL